MFALRFAPIVSKWTIKEENEENKMKIVINNNNKAEVYYCLILMKFVSFCLILSTSFHILFYIIMIR